VATVPSWLEMIVVWQWCSFIGSSHGADSYITVSCAEVLDCCSQYSRAVMKRPGVQQVMVTCTMQSLFARYLLDISQWLRSTAVRRVKKVLYLSKDVKHPFGGLITTAAQVLQQPALNL
jgi:hypothetical protein